MNFPIVIIGVTDAEDTPAPSDLTPQILEDLHNTLTDGTLEGGTPEDEVTAGRASKLITELLVEPAPESEVAGASETPEPESDCDSALRGFLQSLFSTLPDTESEVEGANCSEREDLIRDLATVFNTYGVDTVCDVSDRTLAEYAVDSIEALRYAAISIKQQGS